MITWNDDGGLPCSCNVSCANTVGEVASSPYRSSTPGNAHEHGLQHVPMSCAWHGPDMAAVMVLVCIIVSGTGMCLEMDGLEGPGLIEIEGLTEKYDFIWPLGTDIRHRGLDTVDLQHCTTCNRKHIQLSFSTPTACKVILIIRWRALTCIGKLRLR